MTYGTASSLPGDIKLIDDRFLGQPHLIGTHILPGERLALVDPGPATTLDSLEAGLAGRGLSLSDIHAVLLTHIHLDHAGATGTIVARAPHVQVYVHVIGAPHVIAPERLIRSAARLYGDLMNTLWGDILPVPAENVTAVTDGQTIRLGKRAVDVHYTPGHASHHVTYFDRDTGAAFVGDVTGVRLPGTPYVRPATPPPDVDLEAWAKSLQTLVELDPAALLLTHFGPGLEPTTHIAEFRDRLWRWAETVKRGVVKHTSDLQQMAELQAMADSELAHVRLEKGVAEAAASAYEIVTPLDQSWQGLARYWHKRESNG
jgi:glyoxylase-like metal-dependent hydrolase (beta-lactamase superfamily II)